MLIVLNSDGLRNPERNLLCLYIKNKDVWCEVLTNNGPSCIFGLNQVVMYFEGDLTCNLNPLTVKNLHM